MSETKENSVAQGGDLLAVVRDMFERRIAFNRFLGLTILSMGTDEASVRLTMREEFVGNFARGILHGGVISATLDATAGLVAYSSLASEASEMSREERFARFSRVGTIDMRVDFLRPGRGNCFIASARTLRKGSRVSVIHTEMHDETGEMIASGTCTYMVG